MNNPKAYLLGVTARCVGLLKKYILSENIWWKIYIQDTESEPGRGAGEGIL